MATFGSWDVFNAIAEHVEGATYVNAGFETFESPDAAVRQMSRLQTLATTPWDSVRHDYYTHQFTMSYLARERPRVSRKPGPSTGTSCETPPSPVRAWRDCLVYWDDARAGGMLTTGPRELSERHS